MIMAVGTLLGRHRINIATMDVGRPTRGGTALMGLVLDNPILPGPRRARSAARKASASSSPE